MISHQHRKFFHAAILSPILAMDKLVFNDIKIGDHIFAFSPKRMYGSNKEGLSRLKHFIKQLDLNYPLDGDAKASSERLSDKELVDHIEFIRKIVAESGEILPVDEAEWNRTFKNHGYKEL